MCLRKVAPQFTVLLILGLEHLLTVEENKVSSELSLQQYE